VEGYRVGTCGFGLGRHDRVDKREVIWRNGIVETLTNLAADRFYAVRKLLHHRVGRAKLL
jgi:hypothetical protein